MLEQQLLVDQAIEDAALLGGIEVDAAALARQRAGEARQRVARDRLAVHHGDGVRGTHAPAPAPFRAPPRTSVAAAIATPASAPTTSQRSAFATGGRRCAHRDGRPAAA